MTCCRTPTPCRVPQLNGDEKRQYEIERNGRERMVQLIAFSGLLYTSGIISEKIIHSCVDVLIKVRQLLQHKVKKEQ